MIGAAGLFSFLLACSHLHEPTGPSGGSAQVSSHPEATEPEPVMVRIPPGPFLMGSDAIGRAERPVHRVYLDEYAIGQFEVTNAQFKLFCDATGRPYPEPRWSPDFLPSSPSDLIVKPGYPVAEVNWDDATTYCRWLSEKTGKTYRLPTEAEWEKAARGGSEAKKYPWGDEEFDAGDRYRANSGSESDNDRVRAKDGHLYTAPVGSFQPNGYGLYDVAGNVMEWCSDVYQEDYYSRSPDINPQGPADGEKRALRGGSWFGGPGRMMCAARLWNYPSIRYASTGFRVARTP